MVLPPPPCVENFTFINERFVSKAQLVTKWFTLQQYIFSETSNNFLIPLFENVHVV